jgi:hypothetical protein
MPPVVGVEEFFDGNAYPPLIGANLVGFGHPGLEEFCRSLRAVKREPTVQDILNMWPWEAALIPPSIRQVLSTIRKHQVQALLMGGKVYVFYGAAQISTSILSCLRTRQIFRNYKRLRYFPRSAHCRPTFDPEALARRVSR